MNNKINIANIETVVFTADTAEKLKDEFDKWRAEAGHLAGFDFIQVVSLSGDKPAIMVIFIPY